MTELTKLRDTLTRLHAQHDDSRADRIVLDARIADTVAGGAAVPPDYPAEAMALDGRIQAYGLAIAKIEAEIRSAEAAIRLQVARVTQKRREPLEREAKSVRAQLQALIGGAMQTVARGLPEPEGFWEKRTGLEARLVEIDAELVTVTADIRALEADCAPRPATPPVQRAMVGAQ